MQALLIRLFKAQTKAQKELELKFLDLEMNFIVFL